MRTGSQITHYSSKCQDNEERQRIKTLACHFCCSPSFRQETISHSFPFITLCMQTHAQHSWHPVNVIYCESHSSLSISILPQVMQRPARRVRLIKGCLILTSRKKWFRKSRSCLGFFIFSHVRPQQTVPDMQQQSLLRE